VHAKGQLPADVREVVIDFAGESSRALTRALVDAGLAASTSEAGRKIQQGGVKVGGARVTDLKQRLERNDLPLVIQAGRHVVKLIAS
jgi:tyrosyl-tRNA synthetase